MYCVYCGQEQNDQNHILPLPYYMYCKKKKNKITRYTMTFANYNVISESIMFHNTVG